jgi:hypothetical protein
LCDGKKDCEDSADEETACCECLDLVSGFQADLYIMEAKTKKKNFVA